MNRSYQMLFLSAGLIALFFADVIAGAYFRAAFLSDVAAVLTLAMSSIAFTIAIVNQEREQRAGADGSHDSDTTE